MYYSFAFPSSISVSYFSYLEFLDLNSGTVLFISLIMPGISIWREMSLSFLILELLPKYNATERIEEDFEV